MVWVLVVLVEQEESVEWLGRAYILSEHPRPLQSKSTVDFRWKNRPTLSSRIASAEA